MLSRMSRREIYKNSEKNTRSDCNKPNTRVQVCLESGGREAPGIQQGGTYIELTRGLITTLYIQLQLLIAQSKVS
jgi:hypothetical protein